MVVGCWPDFSTLYQAPLGTVVPDDCGPRPVTVGSHALPSPFPLSASRLQAHPNMTERPALVQSRVGQHCGMWKLPAMF